MPAEQFVDDDYIADYVRKIITIAIYKEASDIHFEPYKDHYRIRLRIDGVLEESEKPGLKLANKISSCLKIMANLDISERRLPQDGRFSFVDKTINRECRISTCPTLHGEKIVIRILSASKLSLNINQLGLEKTQEEILQQTLKKPQGLILITGPTGSGKTVSLYAALNFLNKKARNITTVEDPVEISLSGINQVQVNSKIGRNFANVLRAFLRQDPDIIMVGEVRDLETAEITIRAAQTGHLVLASLHTNSAAETIARLLNLGIKPYTLGGALSLIINQRLVRKLCSLCKKPISIPPDAFGKKHFSPQELTDLKIFSANGCEKCNNGYSGRVGIFETLPISANMNQLVIGSNHYNLIKAVNRLERITLLSTAIEKVKHGLTSLEELHRVI